MRKEIKIETGVVEEKERWIEDGEWGERGNGKMDRKMDAWLGGWVVVGGAVKLVASINRWMNGCLARCWLNEWMDGWMDGWVERWKALRWGEILKDEWIPSSSLSALLHFLSFPQLSLSFLWLSVSLCHCFSLCYGLSPLLALPLLFWPDE